MQGKKIKSKIKDDTSTRQLRVSELIKRSISKILIDSDLYDDKRNNYSASVSEVRCSADLKIATIYILPLNGKDPNILIDFLEKNKVHIRRILGRNLYLKFLPELRFKQDNLLKQIEKTNQIFKSIEKS
ncbi:30S ribosome-binding factor RbfA [Paracoccaceae bacterium]|nr:30S ribosome-binding factor RbfA [Paracoccaceae bacterium]